MSFPVPHLANQRRWWRASLLLTALAGAFLLAINVYSHSLFGHGGYYLSVFGWDVWVTFDSGRVEVRHPEGRPRFLELPYVMKGAALLVPAALEVLWRRLLAADLVKYRKDQLHLLEKQSICVGCGYDLRSSPQRCPECGRVRDLN